MQRILAAFRQFPYTGVTRLLFIEYALLKLFPKTSFPTMNIIPLVMQYFSLDSKEEFRVRYYVSRIGYESEWTSKSRNSRKEIEAFYNEQDGDLWRQAFLSKVKYDYKKKILYAYHIAKKIKAKRVLEYGCGAGVLAHHLKRKGFVVDVADIPSPTLEFVRKQVRPDTILTINPELHLLKEHYDFIACLDVLEHTLTPLDITKTFMKALRPRGYLYVNFPIETNFDPNSLHSHTKEAQQERLATFNYLRDICHEIIPEILYAKKH